MYAYNITLGFFRIYIVNYFVQNIPAFQEIKSYTYKTIILPVVLYDCETWSLTLREEHRLRCSRIKYLGRYLGLREMKLHENGDS